MTHPTQAPEDTDGQIEDEETTWQREAYIYMSVMLLRKRVTYKALASKLQEIGVDETERSIATKINRGAFSFVFFVQVMRALKMKTADLRTFGTPKVPSRGISKKQR